jgi:hypothetical protein
MHMNRKSRRRTIALVMFAVVTSLTLGVIGAQATEGACGGSEVCFWRDGPFDGAPQIDNPNTGTGWLNPGDTGFPAGMDNSMSSWANHKNVDGRWASGASGGGTILRCMDQNSSDGVLTIDANDTMSSYRIYTTNDVCGS